MHNTIVPEVHILVVILSGPDKLYTRDIKAAKKVSDNFKIRASKFDRILANIFIAEGRSFLYVQSKSRFTPLSSDGNCFNLYKI